MEPEDRKMLKEVLAVSRENNRMLKKIRRSARLRTLLQITWLLVLIGVPVFLYYYFLVPYADQVSRTLEEAGVQIKFLQDIGEGKYDIRGYLNDFRAGVENPPDL